MIWLIDAMGGMHNLALVQTIYTFPVYDSDDERYDPKQWQLRLSFGYQADGDPIPETVDFGNENHCVKVRNYICSQIVLGEPIIDIRKMGDEQNDGNG